MKVVARSLCSSVRGQTSVVSGMVSAPARSASRYCGISVASVSRAIKVAAKSACSFCGPAAFARQLSASNQTVSNWTRRKAAPANRCAEIQQLTGVDRRELRPDDWRDYWPELITPDPERAEARA